MDQTLHSLLKRQLKRCGLDGGVPEAWRGFVALVNEAYRQADNERAMLEQSLDLSSQELFRANAEMRAVLQAIPDLLMRLDADGTIHSIKASPDDDVLVSTRHMVGKRIQSIHIPDIAADYEIALHSVTDSGEPVSFEYSLMDGEQERHYEVRLLPLPGRQIFAMVRNITDGKKAAVELEYLNHQLMEASRTAGMAEVATSVLHNVGNVLNSVNVSATLVADSLRQSRLPKIARAAAMLEGRNGTLGEFLTNDPKGKLVPAYLKDGLELLVKEHAEMLTEVSLLADKVGHIKQVVSMQQSFARISGVAEMITPAELVEDALHMNATGFERHQILVIRHFNPAPRITVDRHKALQILINLLSNAKAAMNSVEPGQRRLEVTIETRDHERVAISVRDHGMGISAENLVRVFQHGFTTKKDGHGFGLHSAANGAREMGGNLTVRSEGEGLGAEFTLELPAAITTL